MRSSFIRIRNFGGIGLLLAFLVGSVPAASAKDYTRIGFEQLAAMEYDPVAPEASKRRTERKDRTYLEGFVPEGVLGLDGKSVEIPGYMLPTSIDGEKVREFLLMPDMDSCCFGVMPALNSYVFARAKKGVNLFDNIPVRIRGKLKVEEVWQGEFFSHLYYVEVDELAVGFGTSGAPAVIEP